MTDAPSCCRFCPGRKRQMWPRGQNTVASDRHRVADVRIMPCLPVFVRWGKRLCHANTLNGDLSGFCCFAYIGSNSQKSLVRRDSGGPFPVSSSLFPISVKSLWKFYTGFFLAWKYPPWEFWIKNGSCTQGNGLHPIRPMRPTGLCETITALHVYTTVWFIV